MKDYKVLSNNANSDEACALRWVKIVLSMLIFHPSIPKHQPYEKYFCIPSFDPGGSMEPSLKIFL
jgi:hypothetical protein